MFGLGLPGFLQARAEAADRPSARARSCIFIFLGGGPSHLDIWDMKPQAPTEVRGEFQPIATSAPGIELTEHLPLLAKQAHHLAVLRALEMPGVINTHHWGFYYLHTGHPPEAARTALQGGTSYPLPDDWPFLGSVVAAKLPPPKDLPAAVQLPYVWNDIQEHPYGGNFGGRLGNVYDPFMIRFDPKSTARRGDTSKLWKPKPIEARWESLAIPQLTLRHGVDYDRFAARRTLQDQLEQFQRTRDASSATSGYQRFQQQAYTLLTSPDARRALDIEEEPAKIRDRYGRTINGQSALMCRRLVEAGVPFVNFQWLSPREYHYNWDTHVENFRALKTLQLPALDQALSSLLLDLEERGLLETTLVVVASDMGRTPKVGDPLSSTGRNHWNYCQTALLAGGGIQGGQIYGASDKIGAYPIDSPVQPEHIAATVYDALGIYDNLWATNFLEQPFHLLEKGHPLPLFG